MVISLIRPITGGNASPTILATALINAMEAAAATPDTVSVVTAQKIGMIAQFSAMVNTSRT
ncbi:hypothetical protein D3C78_1704780 [compost metagenome]